MACKTCFDSETESGKCCGLGSGVDNIYPSFFVPSKMLSLPRLRQYPAFFLRSVGRKR